METYFYQNLGEKVRQWRKKKKLSQKELAEKLGKSSSTYINLIESGKRKVGLEKLIQMSQALGVNLNVFLGDHQSTDSQSLLQLALESEKKLNPEQKNMIMDFVQFLKDR